MSAASAATREPQDSQDTLEPAERLAPQVRLGSVAPQDSQDTAGPRGRAVLVVPQDSQDTLVSLVTAERQVRLEHLDSRVHLERAATQVRLALQVPQASRDTLASQGPVARQELLERVVPQASRGYLVTLDSQVSLDTQEPAVHLVPRERLASAEFLVTLE